MPGLVDLAKETLRLPAQIGYPKPLGGVLDRVDDPEFATVIGLLLWSSSGMFQDSGHGSWISSLGIQGAVGEMKRIFGKFMP